jgi:hypothetical protein
MTHLPTNKSKAAGFKSSKELSSFRGVRHFWQCIVDGRGAFARDSDVASLGDRSDSSGLLPNYPKDCMFDFKQTKLSVTSKAASEKLGAP